MDMENFDYSEPADFYTFGRRGGHARVRTYRRFATGAEAIKFAVEEQTADLLKYSVVETDDERLEAAQISALYNAEAFPLPRRSLV